MTRIHLRLCVTLRDVFAPPLRAASVGLPCFWLSSTAARHQAAGGGRLDGHPFAELQRRHLVFAARFQTRFDLGQALTSPEAEQHARHLPRG